MKKSIFAAIMALISFSASADTSKIFSVGDGLFGAQGNYSFADSVSGDTYRAKLGAVAKGNVLGLGITLGSGDCNVNIRRPSTTRAFGSLSVVGVRVANWDKTLTQSGDFSTSPFFQAAAGGTARYGVGPVTLKLKCSAQIKVYAKGSVSVTWPTKSATPTLDATLGPALDASASGSVDIDAFLASAGVNAGLAINGYGVTGRVTYVPSLKTKPKVFYAVTADTVSTNGSIGGWVKIGRGWFSRKWSRTFASYQGGPSSSILTQGSRQL